MPTDIQRTCVQCGEQFLWTTESQARGRRLGVLTAPNRCPKHDTEIVVRTRAIATVKTPADSTMPAMMATTLDIQQLLAADDLKRLLAESVAPVIDRRRTFSEWRRGADIRAEQHALKIHAGATANTLVKQRLEFVNAVMEISQKANQYQLEQRQTELAVLKLDEEIAERKALRELRLTVQEAVEHEKRRQLQEAAVEQPSGRERVLEEHRKDRHARVRAAREQLDDFLREVRLVCESPASVHERALMMRNLLAAFEMDEESLPADARWILRTAERIRDAS